MNYTIKVKKDGEMILNTRTHKIRGFMKKVHTINWEIKGIKVYLKVTYGRFLDNYGKYSIFHNDGDYKDKDEFELALDAFLEK